MTVKKHILRAPTTDRYPLNVPVDSAGLNRQVVAMYSTNAGAAIANATDVRVDFLNKVRDSHNAVAVGASWGFTAPVAGVYLVASRVTFDNFGAAPGAAFLKYLRVFKNAVLYKPLSVDRKTMFGIEGSEGTCLVTMNVGDVLHLECRQESGGPVVLLATDANNFVDIVLVAP